MNQQAEMAPSARPILTREEWDAARVTRHDEYGGG
jgi:hypothetical protein